MNYINIIKDYIVKAWQRKPLRVFVWQMLSVGLTSLLALATDSAYAFALVPLINALIKEFNTTVLGDFGVIKQPE